MKERINERMSENESKSKMQRGTNERENKKETQNWPGTYECATDEHWTIIDAEHDIDQLEQDMALH